MAEREMLTQERVQQIVDGSKVDPNGYEFEQIARLALKQFEARALIVQMREALVRAESASRRSDRFVDAALTAADAYLKANP